MHFKVACCTPVRCSRQSSCRTCEVSRRLCEDSGHCLNAFSFTSFAYWFVFMAWSSLCICFMRGMFFIGVSFCWQILLKILNAVFRRTRAPLLITFAKCVSLALVFSFSRSISELLSARCGCRIDFLWSIAIKARHLYSNLYLLKKKSIAEATSRHACNRRC